MRNRLEAEDASNFLDNFICYWARGELDGMAVTVMAFGNLDEVRIATKGDLSLLSPDAALELAKHLELAVQAIRKEAGHE